MDEYVVDLGPHNLVLITEDKGYLMCGLLDIAAAEKLGHAACKVTGVSTPKDALAAKVVQCTSKARELGVTDAMTGEQALQKMR